MSTKQKIRYNTFINKKTNYSRNMFGNKNCIIKFDKSLKSVNTGDLYRFTNFFPNKKNLYKFVKRNISDILNNRISLIDSNLFEMKLVLINDYYLKLKITNILELTLNEKVRSLPTLYKFKEVNNKELQYYVEKINVDTYVVKFIDIYHLVIPSPNYDLNEIEEHSKEKYESNKDNKVNLSEIKEELGI